MSKSAFMTSEWLVAGSNAEIKTAFATWGIYFAATCAYCLLHQALVSSVTPDFAKTAVLAIREWGIWSVLTPVVFMRLSASERDEELRPGNLASFAALILLIAVSVPLVIDQLTEARSAASSVAIFLPRYAATLVVLYLVWCVILRRSPQPSSSGMALAPTAEQPPSALLVDKGADKCLLPLDEIQYLSADGNYVEVHARNQCYLMRATMKQIEAGLPVDGFVRIHRSHIVRVQEIERIAIHRSGSGTVYLRGGASLGLSKSYRAALEQYRLRCT